MNKINNENHWLIPEWPAPSHVKALSTLRTGGYSKSPYDSFNLGAFVEDDKDTVLKNKRLLRETAKLPAEPCWLKQVHGTEVIDLSSYNSSNLQNDKQSINTNTNAVITSFPIADASVAFKPNQVCVVTTADCLPILLCDNKGTRVAAVHAGWRGLAIGVIESAVKSMHCTGDKLLAWLGPAIGPEVFEVGQEVRDLFTTQGDEIGFVSFGEKWKLDMYQVAASRLKRLGVEQIYGGGLCTYSDAERFFSYRRATQQGTETGRMATLIWLSSTINI